MRFPVSLFALLSCALTLSAAEPEFRFYGVPPSFFTAEETGAFPKSGQLDPTTLLKKRGLNLPGGSIASYDAAGSKLYLRAPRRDLDLMERLIEDANRPSASLPYEPKQVRLTAICYAIPLSALPDPAKPISAVSELDAKKLNVVDRRTLLVRSGQRSKSENTIPAPPPADPSAEPPPPKDHRLLEAEATVGEDGDTIDVNLALEFHTPDLAAPGNTADFTLATQALMHNKSRLLHELGTTSETEPRLVIWELSTALEEAAPTSPKK